MNVLVINDSRVDDWNDYVMKHPDSLAWHRYEWKDVVQKHYEADFYPLAVIEDETIHGVLPLFHTGGALHSVAFAVAGGVIADSMEYASALIDEAAAMAERLQVGRVIFKQYKHRMEGELTVDNNYYNRELRIDRPHDEIKKEFSSVNIGIIDQYSEAGLSLDFSSEQVPDFYRLLFKHQTRNGVPCVSREWISDLVTSGMYAIATLRQGKRILAATLVKQFKKTVSFPFTCARGDDRLNVSHVYMLYWKLIKHYSDNGMEIFHSGRIPRTNKTNRYRLGWGGTDYTYWYQYWPRRSSATEFSKKRGLKRELLSTLWKMAPTPILRFLGPRIVARYP
jgi:hypothetical protein